MLPIGDDDTARRTVPLVTYALIALNILFFFVEQSGGDAFVGKWAFVPRRFLANPSGDVPTLFTSMLMHAGWLHLGGNMLYLWIFGDNVDHTVVAEMVRRGELDRAEARRHRLRHVITNVVGGTEVGVHAEAHSVELRRDDALLLCSALTVSPRCCHTAISPRSCVGSRTPRLPVCDLYRWRTNAVVRTTSPPSWRGFWHQLQTLAGSTTLATLRQTHLATRQFLA